MNRRKFLTTTTGLVAAGTLTGVPSTVAKAVSTQPIALPSPANCPYVWKPVALQKSLDVLVQRQLVHHEPHHLNLRVADDVYEMIIANPKIFPAFIPIPRDNIRDCYRACCSAGTYHGVILFSGFGSTHRLFPGIITLSVNEFYLPKKFFAPSAAAPATVEIPCTPSL